MGGTGNTPESLWQEPPRLDRMDPSLQSTWGNASRKECSHPPHHTATVILHLMAPWHICTTGLCSNDNWELPLWATDILLARGAPTARCPGKEAQRLVSATVVDARPWAGTPGTTLSRATLFLKLVLCSLCEVLKLYL